MMCSVFRKELVTMNIFRVAGLACLIMTGVVLADETNTSITIDGVTFEDYHWGTITPTTVSIIHKTGVATIPLQKLPVELQHKFGYDPKSVKEERKAPPSAANENTTAIIAPTAQKHPAEIAGIVSSSPVSIAATITFLNEGKEVRRIYWLDYKGARQPYGELKPGEKSEHHTFLGHAWLVTDPHDNALGLYYPDGQKRVVVLE